MCVGKGDKGGKNDEGEGISVLAPGAAQFKLPQAKLERTCKASLWEVSSRTPLHSEFCKKKGAREVEESAA